MAGLDDRLRTQAAHDDVSGSVLLTRAGQTVFHGCYGLADRAAGEGGRRTGPAPAPGLGLGLGEASVDRRPA